MTNENKSLSSKVAERTALIEELNAKVAAQTVKIEGLNADALDKALQIEVLNSDVAEKATGMPLAIMQNANIEIDIANTNIE